jgi:integrase
VADPTRFLTLDEVLRIIKDLHRRKKRSRSSFLNLIIFRLSCCCGLRRGEIAGLNFSNLVLAGARPCIIVPKAITKGQKDKRRARTTPLWWDSQTLTDLKEWFEFRRAMEPPVTATDPFVCGVSKANYGKRLTGDLLAKRWKTAIRCLGPERVGQLSIHTGRHSFCSLSNAGGHSAVEIRDAVGHRSVTTTNLYLHAYDADDLPDVFAA